MSDVLQGLDRATAVGILARAALSLGALENPATRPLLDDEPEIRQKLLDAARKSAGLTPDDDSPDALEQIGDILDREADDLAAPTDVDAALHRLSESGSLPPDMYEVAISSSIMDWCLDYQLERELILATIHQPDKQQHYGPSSSIGVPSLVSLFVRYFKTKWPFKDFCLLVVGTRNGLTLEVSQAWRIYTPLMSKVWSCANLVQLLEQFADEYGAPVEWEGKSGKFFLSVGTPLPPSLTYKIAARPGVSRTVGITQISQSTDGIATSVLAVCIDVTKYLDLLDRMKLKRGEIVSDLAHCLSPPKPAS